MKTKIIPRYLKLLRGLMVAIFLVLFLLAYQQMTQVLIASVGCHDVASVGWVF